MAYTVTIRANVENVPVAVLTRLRQRLTEIALALDSLPPENALFDSLHESPMRLHAGGWAFNYEVDLRARALVVTGCFEVPT